MAGANVPAWHGSGNLASELVQRRLETSFQGPHLVERIGQESPYSKTTG
ncbi:hypothetical protein LY474_40300 [Myxococcus stipitatus]|nr:hypothetical protein [Myxococcus stipitatus]MCE9674051.1 hypothetical protein [Myxococcus stipitatus]